MIDYVIRCKNGFFSSGEAIRIRIEQGKFTIATNHTHFSGDVESIIELTATRQFKANPVNEVLGDCNKAYDGQVGQATTGGTIGDAIRKQNTVKEDKDQQNQKTDPTRKTTRKR